MASFNFSLNDFMDQKSFHSSVLSSQTNYTPNGQAKALKTTESQGEVKKSLTTWNVSDILQGSAIYKPTALSYNSFNEALSKDLKILKNNNNNINYSKAQVGLMGYDTLSGAKIDIGVSTGSFQSSVNSSTGTGTQGGSGPDTGGRIDPGAGALTAEEVASLIYDLGATDVNRIAIFVAVSYRESRFNPGTYNGEGLDNSHGLWQINTINGANPQYRDWDLTDPRVNAQAMWQMSGGLANLRPWNLNDDLSVIQQHQLPDGSYIDYTINKYLPDALTASRNVARSRGIIQ